MIEIRPTGNSGDFRPDCAELGSWEAHRDLLRLVPIAQAWRGCAGLGLIVTDPTCGRIVGDRFLVSDDRIHWLTVVDLPPGSFEGVRGREVHWASALRTKVRFGMPVLAGPPEAAFDLRAAVRRHRGWAERSAARAADGAHHASLFGALNAVSWAMTADALRHRAAWRCRCARLLTAVGELAPPALSLGEKAVVESKVWMPRAYIPFRRADCHRLFDWCACRSAGSDRRHFSRWLRRQLCAEVGRGMPVAAPFGGIFVGGQVSRIRGRPSFGLSIEARGGERHTLPVTRHVRMHIPPGRAVRAGEVIASEGLTSLPAGWGEMTARERWQHVATTLGRRERLDAWTRAWFGRQVLELGGDFVHVPSDLAAIAARDHTADGPVYWDLTPAMPFFDEALQVFVFPPRRLRHWSALAGTLPGEVAFDLAPTDPRFLRPSPRSPSALGLWDTDPTLARAPLVERDLPRRQPRAALCGLAPDRALRSV